MDLLSAHSSAALGQLIGFPRAWYFGTDFGQSISPASFISDDALTTHRLTRLHKKHESSCSHYGKVLKSSAIYFKKPKPKKTHSGKKSPFGNAALDNC